MLRTLHAAASQELHLTRCLRMLRVRLQSCFSATSGGRARRARRALVRATQAPPVARGPVVKPAKPCLTVSDPHSKQIFLLFKIEFA